MSNAPSLASISIEVLDLLLEREVELTGNQRLEYVRGVKIAESCGYNSAARHLKSLGGWTAGDEGIRFDPLTWEVMQLPASYDESTMKANSRSQGHQRDDMVANIDAASAVLEDVADDLTSQETGRSTFQNVDIINETAFNFNACPSPISTGIVNSPSSHFLYRIEPSWDRSPQSGYQLQSAQESGFVIEDELAVVCGSEGAFELTGSDSQMILEPDNWEANINGNGEVVAVVPDEDDELMRLLCGE